MRGSAGLLITSVDLNATDTFARIGLVADPINQQRDREPLRVIVDRAPMLPYPAALEWSLPAALVADRLQLLGKFGSVPDANVSWDSGGVTPTWQVHDHFDAGEAFLRWTMRGVEREATGQRHILHITP